MKLLGMYHHWCSGDGVEVDLQLLDKDWAIGQAIFILVMGFSFVMLRTLDMDGGVSYLSYHAVIAALMAAPFFILMHKKDELFPNKMGGGKNISGGVIGITVVLMAITLALTFSSILLSTTSLKFTVLGESWRYKQVREFTTSMEGQGFSATPLADLVTVGDAEGLRESAAAVSGVYYGLDYERAMLSMRLLEMEHDPRYAKALRNGWIHKSTIEEIGKELVQDPPKGMDANGLRQQAFLRIIGDVPLTTAFTD